MSIPISVERTLSRDSDLATLESLAREMVVEFFWYFHYDIDHDAATDLLEHVKKTEVGIPGSLRPESENPERSV